MLESTKGTAPNLQETQRFFQELILKDNQGVAAHIFKDGKGLLSVLSAQKKVEVYRNDYRFRLIQTLAETYPNIKRILGQEAFESLVSRYVQKHPSRSHDLGQLGKALAQFLKKDGLMEDLPFLAELAQAEWLLEETFHRPYFDPLDSKALASLIYKDLESLTFEFQPSLVLLQSSWPILKLLKLKDLADEQINVSLCEKKPCYLMVCQNPDGVVEWNSLDAQEYGMISAFHSGKTLGEISEELLTDQDAPKLQAWITGWLQRGWVVGTFKG